MILAHIRLSSALNRIAIAIVSSEIATLLISSRRTAYSKFKILLQVTKNTILNIEKQKLFLTITKTTNLKKEKIKK